MKVLKAGILYFALVFGAGFVLGPIRILWVVPQVGMRMAELLEMPIMLVVIIASARWLVTWLAVPPTRPSRLAMGFIALGLLLTAELAFVGPIQGYSITEAHCNPGPRVGNGLLRDARSVRPHAAALNAQMRQ